MALIGIKRLRETLKGKEGNLTSNLRVKDIEEIFIKFNDKVQTKK